MNYCRFSLKGVQFLISAIVCILFLAPASLDVNNDVLFEEGHTNLTGIAKVNAKHLMCAQPTYDFADAESEWLGTRDVVIFPEDVGTRSDKVSFDQIRRALGCLQFYTEGDKSECMCWNQYYVIAAVGIAVFTAVISLCDMISIWAAEGQDIETKCVEGFTSFICSVITGVLWIIIGGIVAHYVFLNWPYVYHNKDTNENEKFFKIPAAWYLAIFFCFSFAIIMIMEGIIFLGESGREIHPDPHPEKSHFLSLEEVNRKCNFNA